MDPSLFNFEGLCCFYLIDDVVEEFDSTWQQVALFSNYKEAKAEVSAKKVDKDEGVNNINDDDDNEAYFDTKNLLRC